jgi:hypothetical protein
MRLSNADMLSLFSKHIEATQLTAETLPVPQWQIEKHDRTCSLRQPYIHGETALSMRTFADDALLPFGLDIETNAHAIGHSR